MCIFLSSSNHVILDKKDFPLSFDCGRLDFSTGRNAIILLIVCTDYTFHPTFLTRILFCIHFSKASVSNLCRASCNEDAWIL